MKVFRTSLLDNKEYSMELPITICDLAQGLCLRDGGLSASEALPALKEEHLIFLETGIVSCERGEDPEHWWWDSQ